MADDARGTRRYQYGYSARPLNHCEVCGKSRNQGRHDKCSKIKQAAYQERLAQQ